MKIQIPVYQYFVQLFQIYTCTFYNKSMSISIIIFKQMHF